VEDAAPWRILRSGRCRCRCCAMEPTPSPLTDTTSLNTDHLRRPPPLPLPASMTKIAARATRSLPSLSGGDASYDLASLSPVEQNGERRFSNTLADMWVRYQGAAANRQINPRSTTQRRLGRRHDRAGSCSPQAAHEITVSSRVRQQDFLFTVYHCIAYYFSLHIPVSHQNIFWHHCICIFTFSFVYLHTPCV
jgi:hypothetical protein